MPEVPRQTPPEVPAEVTEQARQFAIDAYEASHPTRPLRDRLRRYLLPTGVIQTTSEHIVDIAEEGARRGLEAGYHAGYNAGQTELIQYLEDMGRSGNEGGESDG